MDNFIKEIFDLVKNKDKEFFTDKTIKCIKEIGKMGNQMELENLYHNLDNNIKVHSRMV